MAKPRPPTSAGSLWAAPQSLKPPPPPRPTSHPRADVYKRRVTQSDQGEEGPAPASWQRWSQLLGGGLSMVALTWFAVWADFGDTEHCFSPVRRLVGVPNSKGAAEKRAAGEDQGATNVSLSLNRISREGDSWKGLLKHPEDFNADEVQKAVAAQYAEQQQRKKEQKQKNGSEESEVGAQREVDSTGKRGVGAHHPKRAAANEARLAPVAASQASSINDPTPTSIPSPSTDATAHSQGQGMLRQNSPSQEDWRRQKLV